MNFKFALQRILSTNPFAARGLKDLLNSQSEGSDPVEMAEVARSW